MIYKEYEDVKPLEFLRALTIYKDSRLLGLDIGKKKIGLAVCDFDNFTPLPLKNLQANNLAEISGIIAEYKIIAIIAGVSEMGDVNVKKRHLKFIRKNISADLPVYFIDEAHSSRHADSLLKETGMNRRKRNAVDDKIAAMLILQKFMERLETY